MLHPWHVSGPMIGHVGDGNFHVDLLHDPDSEVEVKKVKEIADRIAR